MPKIVNLPMEEVIKDYESGMNLFELGLKYGCSDNTIGTRLKKAGVRKISIKEKIRLQDKSTSLQWKKSLKIISQVCL